MVHAKVRVELARGNGVASVDVDRREHRVEGVELALVQPHHCEQNERRKAERAKKGVSKRWKRNK